MAGFRLHMNNVYPGQKYESAPSVTGSVFMRRFRLVKDSTYVLTVIGEGRFLSPAFLTTAVIGNAAVVAAGILLKR